MFEHHWHFNSTSLQSPVLLCSFQTTIVEISSTQKLCLSPTTGIRQVCQEIWKKKTPGVTIYILELEMQFSCISEYLSAHIGKVRPYK